MSERSERRAGTDSSPTGRAQRSEHVRVRFESGPAHCILALCRGSVRVLDGDIRATFLPEQLGTATAPHGGGAGRPEMLKELV